MDRGCKEESVELYFEVGGPENRPERSRRSSPSPANFPATIRPIPASFDETNYINGFPVTWGVDLQCMVVGGGGKRRLRRGRW